MKNLWIEKTTLKSQNGVDCHEVTETPQESGGYIHCRIVEPTFDALVLEIIEALNNISNGILPNGDHVTVTVSDFAEQVLAKYDAYLRGEKK